MDIMDMLPEKNFGESTKAAKITIIGVGGGGGNAANRMYAEGIQDVDFIVCNSDQQDLEKSPIPTKVQLGTNRVYVSRVINRTYNMTFPEYVNGRRLETAKQMLLDDPDAVLEYVALKSGFSGLSQFSRKFKEMTGVSPRAWQASQSKKK